MSERFPGLSLATPLVVLLSGLVSCHTPPDRVAAPSARDFRVIDCSLLVSPDYPCTWPTAPFPRFQIRRERRIGPNSAYNVDVLLIDGNTGTQLDVPPHSVARPELNRPKSGPLGLAYTDKTEAWQFCGEACVIDVRELLDDAPLGQSPLVQRTHVERFERRHRPLRFGDVALFASGYSDAYYRPYPEGRRFVADPVDAKSPAYPNPDPDCMEFLAERGVMTLGTDSPSMGPLPDLAEPTHYAGLKHGMIWTEGATRLHEIPATGAFWCMMGPKHEGGPYGEGRAFAIVGERAASLIESARAKRVIDLSPTLSPSLPLTSPGVGTGAHRQVYLRVDFLYSEYLDLWHHTHLMDGMTGTHLVPPSYALPEPGERIEYSSEVRGWLHEYEAEYGRRGTSTLTTDRVPIEWTCGPARIIDVRDLAGSTNSASWPSSPEVTVEHIEAWELQNGSLSPGDVVILQTGHVDRDLAPPPAGDALWVKPLAGETEGWPAPGPDAIAYLATRGIRCVATDAPDLGGVDPKRALMTYWALGSREMVGVEFLTRLDAIPDEAFFIFTSVKIEGGHGGPGRAIALY